MSPEPVVHECFEAGTGTWQYIVACPDTKAAVLIDSVLDFDPSKNAITTGAADALLKTVQDNGYRVEKILETHVHADHLTAAGYLQHKIETLTSVRPDIGIGKRIGEVQERFAQRFGIKPEEYAGVFDKCFDDDEAFSVGNVQAKTLHLSGHTPDHLGYVIGSNVFAGDSLFNVDVGSARCDFPGGNAKDLYSSVRKLLQLPENFKIYTGHDYPPGGEHRKDPKPYHTVGEQNEMNKHLKKGVKEEEFVRWRNERDAQLAEPRLMSQALQFNIRGGKLPRATETGDRFLHVPVKLQVEAW